MQAKDHSGTVHTTTAVTDVSWFQEHDELSLRLIPDASVLEAEFPSQVFDVWHDGAGCHFLTTEE
jgi:hypothetical protein